MKDTEKQFEAKEKVQDCLIKILDFARAISLDQEDMTTGCIALTMADEIQNYGNEALGLLIDEV